jgi:hypothetical protein
MAEEYISTEEDMRNFLIGEFDEIPRGSRRAYRILRERAGIEDKNLRYQDKISRYIIICRLLGFSPSGGLAGRHIEEY